MNNYDVIILGAGAAGLMCAITAGRRGRRVVVLEGSNRIGKKILMSGGGRCNFTNLYCEPANFLSANPAFCISALSRYTQRDFIALVEKHGIPYHEKTGGQLFCDRSSKDIVSMLELECRNVGVRIETHCGITGVRHDGQYTVTANGTVYTTGSLVVATGGLSIPKMGASDFGYRLARQFGLQVLDTRAGLVPFTLSGPVKAMAERLSGVSLPVTLSCDRASFTGDILFTHRGLSGPAALQLSSYWTPGTEILADLLPGVDALEMLQSTKTTRPRSVLRTVIADCLPRAFVIELQALTWPQHTERPLAEVATAELSRIAEMLHAFPLRPSGTEGYRTAEVTLGGIDTGELSSQSMECRRQPGLYCIGEVVDVTGQLGGFNFQWAWASGVAAGEFA